MVSNSDNNNNSSNNNHNAGAPAHAADGRPAAVHQHGPHGQVDLFQCRYVLCCLLLCMLFVLLMLLVLFLLILCFSPRADGPSAPATHCADEK